jgi:hypothetical protein
MDTLPRLRGRVGEGTSRGLFVLKMPPPGSLRSPISLATEGGE